MHDGALTFSSLHCHLSSVCNPADCLSFLDMKISRLRCHFLSPHRTAPPEISWLSAGRSNEQMWPSWPLTSTRTAPKISSDAWMWRRPCTASTPCPVTCAATPPRRCWSEWESLPKYLKRFWYFYALALIPLRNVFFIISKHSSGDLDELFDFLVV